jgi:hypothetical protein
MVVALLALFVALGGTGYAALNLPANSVGAKQLKKKAVTGKKIRKNAVTSPKVKNFSLLAKDFKAGQLPAGAKGDQGPPGPTFGAVAMGSPLSPAEDPGPTPDEPGTSVTNNGRQFGVTLPTAGNVYVRLFVPLWGVTCSSGGARAGLYLDGAPVPDSASPLDTAGAPTPTEIVAVVSAAAGPHSLTVPADCPNGTISATALSSFPDWTVLLLGS